MSKKILVLEPSTTTQAIMTAKLKKSEYEPVYETSGIKFLVAMYNLLPDAILISAKEEIGFLDLKSKIYELLYGDVANYILPPTQTVLINELKKAGCIEKEEWLDDGVHIQARTVGRLAVLSSTYMCKKEK